MTTEPTAPKNPSVRSRQVRATLLEGGVPETVRVRSYNNVPVYRGSRVIGEHSVTQVLLPMTETAWSDLVVKLLIALPWAENVNARYAETGILSVGAAAQLYERVPP